MPDLTTLQDPPTDQVLDMVQQGYTREQITLALQAQGYTSAAISDALQQATTKTTIEGTLPVPQPSQQMRPSLLNEPSPPSNFPLTSVQPRIQESQNMLLQRGVEEQIQEIVEAVISEKWQKIVEDIGDLDSWKEKIKTDILSIKQEVLRIQNRFDALQTAVTGKIRVYDQSVQDVGTDVKALEKLLQNLLSPLATNVKELKRLTESLNKK